MRHLDKMRLIAPLVNVSEMTSKSELISAIS